MINAGKYNKRISIYQTTVVKDSAGFQSKQRVLVLQPYAHVKTTKGMTLITNGSDFEKAFTRFVFRFPKTEITRRMFVEFNSSGKIKIYSIEYINNVDEAGIEMELQCKEIEH